ncbi:MAG: tetratricopeptide repeat protein [Candidatus Zixiibacteriota bacterium]
MEKRRLHKIIGPIVVSALFLLILGSNLLAQDVKPPIREALNIGDTAHAIELINKDIQLDPAYNINYLTLGKVYFQRGQYSRAKDQFLLALDKKKKDYESTYYLGITYLRLDDPKSAEKLFGEARQKTKGVEKARFEDGYGQVMLAMDSIQAAQRSLIEATRLDSTKSEYFVHLGNSYFKMKVAALAVSNYEKALKTDTGSTEVYYNWAEACLEMKDYNCALEKLRVVLQKDSTHAEAWSRAGGIYFKAAMSATTRDDRNNRFKETLGSYKKYLELSNATPDSSNVRAFFETAMAYSNLGGFDDAVIYFEKVLAIPYTPRDIYFNYGKALWGARNYDKASEALQKHLEWIKTQPDYKPSPGAGPADVYLFLGDSYFYRKPSDYANAVESYRQAFVLDSTNKRILQNIALCYHQLKSYAQALEFYDRRIGQGIDSANANIYKNAGYCALNLGGQKVTEDEEESSAPAVTTDTTAATSNIDYYKKAADYLDKYLSYNPKDAKVLQLLGNTYLFQLKDCANGIKAYERTLAVDPTDCVAKKSLGYAFFGDTGCGKNYTKALEYLTQANDCLAKANGPCSDKDLILWIAQCYHLRAAQKSGDKAAASADFKQAFEWYGRVLKCDPGNKTAKEGQDNTRYEFSK